jgi:hypothetical protein
VNPLVLDPVSCAVRQLLAFDGDVSSLALALAVSPMFRRSAEMQSYELCRLHADEDEVVFPLGRVSFGESTIILDTVSEERESHLVRTLESAVSQHWEWDEQRLLAWEDALTRSQALASVSAPWARDAVAAFFLRGEWVYVPRADLKGRAPFEFIGTVNGSARLEAILPAALADLRDRFPSFPDWNPSKALRILAPQRMNDEAPAASAARAAKATKSRPR